ncbi:unnamed protein product [Porites lobata]|uniref:G-protein coupled receptors family 1 profile domain-containing protein n=1 Tax=Porites lobata TaxID=104759 RepID=A0ABN8RLN7_9CNID|nr:unnamed protein product [Porites lobata]
MSNTSCDPESSLSWNIADYDLVIVAGISSVIIASMSPVTVTGNLLVVLAIWRNESLRSSTYLLVGALSLEYFVSGVLFQPSYAIKELVMVLRPSLIKTSVFYYLHLILGGLGIYTTALTTLTTTLMAIESNFLNLSSSLSKHSSPSTANSSQRDLDVFLKRAIHKHGKVQEISLYNSPYLGFLLFELFAVHCQRFSTLAVRAIAEIDCCL